LEFILDNTELLDERKNLDRNFFRNRNYVHLLWHIEKTEQKFERKCLSKSKNTNVFEMISNNTNID
jgi:hypothetical protein